MRLNQWRRRRDSNPRDQVYLICALSRGVPSATRPLLREEFLLAQFFGIAHHTWIMSSAQNFKPQKPGNWLGFESCYLIKKRKYERRLIRSLRAADRFARGTDLSVSLRAVLLSGLTLKRRPLQDYANVSDDLSSKVCYGFFRANFVGKLRTGSCT